MKISWDAYEVRARLAPACIAAAPLIVLGFQFLTIAWIALVFSLLGFLGVSVATNEVVRSRGRRLEQRLEKEWGGLPTTRMLRSNNTRPDAEIKRRRRTIEKLSGRKLPSSADYRKDAKNSDLVTARVVKIAIETLRRDERVSPLLLKETIGYGYRRNTLALKPIALGILFVACIGGAVGQSISFSIVSIVIGILAFGGLAIYWFVVVRADWVYEQAKEYSERLFVIADSVS